jgi:hypothetical protein
VEHVEERIEIVRALVDMYNKDGPVRADPLTEASNGGPQGRQGVLALRGSVVGNDDGFIAAPECQVSNRLCQERERQVGPASRDPSMPIVRTTTFHNCGFSCCKTRHLFPPKIVRAG